MKPLSGTQQVLASSTLERGYACSSYRKSLIQRENNLHSTNEVYNRSEKSSINSINLYIEYVIVRELIVLGVMAASKLLSINMYPYLLT
jgi:hypothetical protein